MTVNIWGRLRRNTNGSAWKIQTKYFDSLPMLELLYRFVLSSLLIGWKIYLLLIGSTTNYEFFLSTNHRVWQDKLVESWNQGHHDRVIYQNTRRNVWQHFRGGLKVCALASGWSGLGSSPGRGIVLCSSARHVTLTMPLSTQSDFTFFTLFVGYANSGLGPLPSFQHVIEKLHEVAWS